MRNLDWNEGAPDELKAGMAVQWPDGNILLIGDFDDALSRTEHRDDDYIRAVASIAKPA